MIIKKGKVDIVDVIKDDEHAIDDEGTRKAMERAGQKPTLAEVLACGNTGEGAPIEIPCPKDLETN